jgi:uncharacterized protein YndB with AHSA1/START domain
MTIAPIRKTFMVKAPPAKAFAAFTQGMVHWWPKTHTIAPHPFVEVVVEPREGGRWFERDADGAETNWGKVLAWDPPGRLTLAWQIDASWKYDPDLVTEVDLTFTAQDGGSLVAFEHRHLERLGESAQALAEMLSGGWPGILDLFAGYAAASAETKETQS